MDEIRIMPANRYGRDFIPGEYLPAGTDEYTLRNAQGGKPKSHWRPLTFNEIETLVHNGNTCHDWNEILVADPFAVHLVRNSIFAGLVRIGRLEEVVLEHHSLQLAAGIVNSTIVASDIGENCAIHNVSYLSHYIIGDGVILFNIDEMHTTNHAKFGNGIVKDGEKEEVRIRIDLANEAGGRSILAFDGILSADAALWVKRREDRELMARLEEMTQNRFDARRGFYGTVGDRCVIKNTMIVKDVKFGPHCYVKGANKLKNLTINSSAEEPTQIGEGVELVNGIIEHQCRIFYGSKAVRFIMGRNSALKYGARLIHSFLGANSTVSCCELLNNLIFPAHEQHHNNSFLIASVVMGQSNMAAGATIGSNHNSRANDGEILAGRGFWPGLCVSVKHSSRFAAFTLLAKGAYPAELDVRLPFSLLNNDETGGRLEVMPAFWWLHNMYALARNAAKFRGRDKRVIKRQHIEFEPLAPDTVEEIFAALPLLETWTAEAHSRRHGLDPGAENLAALGRRLLEDAPAATAELEVLAKGMERSPRPAVILKARDAWHAYRRMIRHYAMTQLMAHLAAAPSLGLAAMTRELAGPRETDWVNLGGQLVRRSDLDGLVARIKDGTISTWKQVHSTYDVFWAAYPREKRRHALASLLALDGEPELTPERWREELDRAIETQEYIRDQVFRSRQKDYENPFRRATFDSDEEMKAVVGAAEENAFIKEIRRETEEFKRQAEELKKRA
jgi:NDP-sugar pyrophosphorylase family protein